MLNDLRKTITTLVHITKSFKLETKTGFEFQPLSKLPANYNQNGRNPYNFQYLGFAATHTDPTTQIQTLDYVDRLTSCSPRLILELVTHPSDPIYRSLSSSSLHGSEHHEASRTGASVDLQTQPRSIAKRVSKSTRRVDYVYLMYEYWDMDGSRYWQ